MRIKKSVAVQVAIVAAMFTTYFAVSSQADDMTINNPNPSPITEQVDVAPAPTLAPAVDAPASPEPEVVAEKVVPVPVVQQGVPRNPPPWTPIPLPPTGERQPASPPQGKQWQEGPGCDMSVRSCTAVEVYDPMPEGCMMYDQLNHVCLQWKDTP